MDAIKTLYWDVTDWVSDLWSYHRRYVVAGLGGSAALLLLGLWLLRSDPAGLAASAEQRLRHDDFIGAAIEARASLKNDNAFVPGRLALAKALLASGDLDGASIELERAEFSGLKRHEAAALWGAIGLAKGDLEAVEKRLAEVTDAPPANQADLLVLRARALALRGRPEAAELLLKQAMGLVPSHQAATLQRARMAASAGEGRLAEDLVQVAIAKDPGSADAWLLKGDLARRAGEPAEAVAAAYSKALQLKPRMDLAHERLVLLALANKDVKGASAQADAMLKALPNHVMAIHLKALTAYWSGQFTEARELAQRALKGGKDFPPSLMVAGLAERQLGAPAQAETLFNKAVAALPEAPEPRRELASLQLAGGRGSDALETLSPLLAAKATADDWRMAGRAHSMQGDFRKADEAFGRASKVDPGNSRVSLERGLSLLVRGDTEQGLSQLQVASTAKGSDTSADMALVAALMSQRRFDDARKAAAELIRKQPSAVGHLLMGRVLVALGDRPGAARSFEAALSMQAGFLPAVAGLAQIDVDTGNLKSARQRYEAVLKGNPRSAEALLALAAITRLEGGTRAAATELLNSAVAVDPTHVQTWQQAIDQQWRTGDAEGARERARRAVAALPDNPDLQAKLGSMLSASGEHQLAVAAYSAWVKLRPNSVDAQLRLAQALVMIKQPGAARTHVLKAVELAPDSPAVLRSQAALLIHEQRTDALQALVARTQKRLPKSAIGWQLEADQALAAANTKAAIKALLAASAKDDGGDAALQLSKIYAGQDDKAVSRQFQDSWLKAHPTDRAVRLSAANQAMAERDWDRSERLFRQLLELVPSDPLVMNNLAYVLVQRKDKGALALAQRAARAAPDLAAVVDTVALAFASAAQLDQAIEWQTRAVDLEPKMPVFRLQLARYQLQAGNKSKAREQLELIKDLATEFPEQKKLVRELLFQAGA